MAAIEVRIMEPYVKGKHQVFPDLAACIIALPLVDFENAKGGEQVDEFVCYLPGETHKRVYSVAEVRRQLGMHPEWSCLFGIGNVDPEHGWNWTPGRHVLGFQK